jgi:hypothetical protein
MCMQKLVTGESDRRLGFKDIMRWSLRIEIDN